MMGQQATVCGTSEQIACAVAESVRQIEAGDDFCFPTAKLMAFQAGGWTLLCGFDDRPAMVLASTRLPGQSRKFATAEAAMSAARAIFDRVQEIHGLPVINRCVAVDV